MGTLMKTTVEISDALLEAARRLAAQRGTTLRAVLEEGLRSVVEGSTDEAFVLRDASIGGGGLQPDVEEGGWARMAELANEGRGG
jgi:hypothetical protein